MMLQAPPSLERQDRCQNCGEIGQDSPLFIQSPPLDQPLQLLFTNLIAVRESLPHLMQADELLRRIR